MKHKTSDDALRAVEARLPALQKQVLRCVRGANGATDDEIQAATGMNPSTQRPRRVELVEARWLYDSGERRRTRAGSSAIVWQARTESERAMLDAGCLPFEGVEVSPVVEGKRRPRRESADE